MALDLNAIDAFLTALERARNGDELRPGPTNMRRRKCGCWVAWARGRWSEA